MGESAPDVEPRELLKRAFVVATVIAVVAWEVTYLDGWIEGVAGAGLMIAVVASALIIPTRSFPKLLWVGFWLSIALTIAQIAGEILA